MSPAKPRSRLLEFALIFGVAYLVSTGVMRYLYPQDAGPAAATIELAMEDSAIRDGHHPVAVITNRTPADFTLAARCPRPPFDIAFIENPGTPEERALPTAGTGTAIPCEASVTVAPDDTTKVSLAPWKYSVFGRLGTYEVRFPEGAVSPALSSGSMLSARVEIYQPGVIVQMFRRFITKPFLNFLILVASLLPDHNLGIGIIVLTLVVKILLFLPTQHALEGQKKMQLLQPKLEALKKQHAGNQQKLQEETIRLWKEHKINPFQSCLPILLQFPVLIGLFFVIRDGAVLELSRHLIYSTYAHLDWQFGHQFLGFDLTQPSYVIMPASLVILQYVQMKLSLQIASTKAKQTGKETPQDPAQRIQQQVMLYALPLMIGVFAFQFPAAVSLYWGISTLFAIGQQVIVNREHLKV